MSKYFGELTFGITLVCMYVCMYVSIYLSRWWLDILQDKKQDLFKGRRKINGHLEHYFGECWTPYSLLGYQSRRRTTLI